MLNDGVRANTQVVVRVPKPASSWNVWVTVCGSGSLRSNVKRGNSFRPVWGRLVTMQISGSRSEAMAGTPGAFIESRMVEASSDHGTSPPHEVILACQPQFNQF